MYLQRQQMIDVQLFKASTVADLYTSIAKNLEQYRSGSFDAMLHDTSLLLDSACKLDPILLTGVTCKSGDDNEVACCLGVTQGLSGITAYLARDERLWARLTHIELLSYTRARWPIPVDDTKAVEHIKKHFFAKGARGIERDNAVSRLWWMAEICKRVEGLSHEQALSAFLYQSDVRANIVERPTTSQNPALLSAVVNKLHQSYLGDKALYNREKFRAVMKKLNIEGGVRLLEVLDSKTLEKVIDKVSQ
jgi:hypothetical protein